MKTITSTSNPYIKFIRGLQTARGRKKSGKFFIEGIHLVDVCLQNEYPIECVLYCPELLRSEYALRFIEEIKSGDYELIEVSAQVFISIANKEGPQGIAAVGEQKYYTPAQVDISGLWVALQGVQDPGNLGTILRSLDGANGKGLILIGETTNPFHPTAVRAGTGALFRLPIVSMQDDEFVSWRSMNRIFMVGTICDPAPSYRSITYPEDMILLMGSEQKGLSAEFMRACDQLITIPMGGQVDSLNLSNAASIVLFEIYTKGLNND